MTHSGTHFSDMTGMHMMTGNMLVSVDATLQPDGTWIVDHVQSQMGAGGAMAAGVVTGIVGNPPSQLTLVMHDGVGNGMMSSSLAGTTTVNLGSTTQFAIDADDVDLSGLPFTPQFDPAHLSKGQAIRAWSNAQFEHDGHGMGGMVSGGTVTASSIYLKHQGLRGTVSGYASNGSQASFTLTAARRLRVRHADRDDDGDGLPTGQHATARSDCRWPTAIRSRHADCCSSTAASSGSSQAGSLRVKHAANGTGGEFEPPVPGVRTARRQSGTSRFTGRLGRIGFEGRPLHADAQLHSQRLP